jgi:Ca-activated chloride channel family protein
VRRLHLAALLAASWLTFPAAHAPQLAFRSGADLVHFAVTVTDRRDAIVADLTGDDFELTEDGTVQTITQFARSTDTNAPDLHVGLMLDTSESMREALDTAQTAALRFASRLPEAADLTLVDFDAEVRISRFSHDDARLVERIRTRQTAGWTALYDAFGAYLQGAGSDDGRTVLVAFTDGGDSRSSMRFGDLLTEVRASTATIYVVGLLEHAPADSRNQQRLRLAQIAEASGGQAIFPTSLKQIEAAYDGIVAELRGQYSLGYVSTNDRRDGRWRDVRIRLKDPARRDLRLRHRSGYFAGAEP